MAFAKHLTEIPRAPVFICQTGQIHDSRGLLLVRIGKVTVVRRPLRSMVCSGRLTMDGQPIFLITSGVIFKSTLSRADAIGDIDDG